MPLNRRHGRPSLFIHVGQPKKKADFIKDASAFFLLSFAKSFQQLREVQKVSAYSLPEIHKLGRFLIEYSIEL